MTGGLAERAARVRIPLGFALAGVVVWLARPTMGSVVAGAIVAGLGEALRVWAAGHLEKSREVTRSGPYRFTRHPLYLGSSLMGLGFILAARHLVVAVLVTGYVALTFAAAIRREEAFLRERFGGEYDAYARGSVDAQRRFSFERALRNREYRAVGGLLISLGVLGVKALYFR